MICQYVEWDIYKWHISTSNGRTGGHFASATDRWWWWCWWWWWWWWWRHNPKMHASIYQSCSNIAINFHSHISSNEFDANMNQFFLLWHHLAIMTQTYSSSISESALLCLFLLHNSLFLSAILSSFFSPRCLIPSWIFSLFWRSRCLPFHWCSPCALRNMLCHFLWVCPCYCGDKALLFALFALFVPSCLHSIVFSMSLSISLLLFL